MRTRRIGATTDRHLANVRGPSDGLTDGVQTAEAFAEHFRITCTSFNDDQNTHLQSIYQTGVKIMLAIHFSMIINLM